MTSIARRLESLMNEPRANLWLTDNNINVYVRISTRCLLGGGWRSRTIDIANVTVKQYGQGHFTRFLQDVEVLAEQHGMVVYIENILEPRFADFFRRRGYTMIEARCAYKEPATEKRGGTASV